MADNHREEAFARLAQEAEDQIIEAGMSGGKLHDQIDASTIHLATSNWMLREIRRALREHFNPSTNGRIHYLKRHGPSAGAGMGLASLVWWVLEALTGITP